MRLYKLLLIASLSLLPAASWADEVPPPPEAAADTTDAALDAAADPLITGTLDPVGEAEEVWMTPAEDRAGGSCHHGQKKSTVYYTN